MVHMVFAIMFFQYAARNWEDAAQQSTLTNASNMHYHYSLSMFYNLSCSHTVQDVQALTLICSHLRNFPKPGASWILTQTTMSLAIELGLHRSAKRWTPDTVPNPLDVEMRKRTFWALLAIHVTLSGKLGRPMPFRIEDFDVEMPEPLDDELLTEDGLDTSRPGKCIHEIGLQAIRLLPLFMELYSTIYAVRRSPENYIPTINRLEAKLRAWQEGLPPDLVKGQAGENEQEGRVFALYALMWALEFRLLLRHPSVSATTDATFNAESMRICVESSRKMLGVVRQLQKFRSLDTTWYNSAVYVCAITTTLFAQWDKRKDASAADLAALREEMDIWLDIMGDVGSLLGM
jgi:Fungal specific transcription factor domain